MSEILPYFFIVLISVFIEWNRPKWKKNCPNWNFKCHSTSFVGFWGHFYSRPKAKQPKNIHTYICMYFLMLFCSIIKIDREPHDCPSLRLAGLRPTLVHQTNMMGRGWQVCMQTCQPEMGQLSEMWNSGKFCPNGDKFYSMITYIALCNWGKSHSFLTL